MLLLKIRVQIEYLVLSKRILSAWLTTYTVVYLSIFVKMRATVSRTWNYLSCNRYVSVKFYQWFYKLHRPTLGHVILPIFSIIRSVYFHHSLIHDVGILLAACLLWKYLTNCLVYSIDAKDTHIFFMFSCCNICTNLFPSIQTHQSNVSACHVYRGACGHVDCTPHVLLFLKGRSQFDIVH